MKDLSLIKWLKAFGTASTNWPAKEAALRMEEMRCALIEISEMDCDYSILYAIELADAALYDLGETK